MVENLSQGRIYKGSNCQITVQVFPKYYIASAVTDVVLNFYTNDKETSVQFSGETIYMSGNTGTIVFQPIQLEILEDGVLRYVSEYKILGEKEVKDYETRFYIKTPKAYTPIDFISEEEVDEKIETETGRTESTYQKILIAGEGIRISGTTISCIGGGGQGPQGPQGARGEQGEQGPQGDRGANGADGVQGDVGAQGARGAQGDRGEQGEQGPQGDKGANGADGAQGPQGVKGDRGEQGIQGPQGDKGANGADGAQGPQGVRGEQGEQGPQGDKGANGADGVQGNVGAQGARGAQGDRGEQGVQGPRGIQGIGNISSSTIDTIWTGTQAEYEALTPVNNTLYFING